MNRDTIRLLLVDDDPEDVLLTERTLKKVQEMQSDLAVAASLTDALLHVRSSGFDVILLDLGLPETSGLETLRRVRQENREVAIVVLTGLTDDAVALEALDQGAQDYICKGEVTPRALSRSIRYAIQRHQSYLEIQQLLARVQCSQDLLERKNRRLARLYKTAHRFVDNVSHEFRTPLMVVKEYVSLMRDGLLGQVNDEQVRALEVIEDRADDLNNMVDDMLDVSKLQSGLLGAWRKNCTVQGIVEHALPALRTKAVVRRVRLEVDLADDLPHVYCDAEKAGRTLVNLTVNAIKFCDESGWVRIWAKQDPASRSIVVGVTDNGPGIDQAALQAIFERFKQLETGTHNSTKGFGLGLSIAKELVDLNLGEIEVQSQLGRGSTFTFTLPPADPREVLRRYLDRLERRANGSARLTLLAAHCPDWLEPHTADAADAFLNYLLRRNDLLFRIDEAHWVLALPADHCELGGFFRRMDQERQRANRNRPHGPLPELDVRIEGTWRVRDERDAILATLALLVEARETVHA
jgi:signal transduction histidine kinase